MSSEGNTPPGIAPSWHRIDVLERDVRTHHDRLNSIRTQQIEGFGQDGRGGIVGRVLEDIKDSKLMIHNLAETVQSMRREAAADRARLMVMMSIASAIGAGIVGAIFRLV